MMIGKNLANREDADDDDAIGKAQCLESSVGFMRLEQSPGRNKLLTAALLCWNRDSKRQLS